MRSDIYDFIYTAVGMKGLFALQLERNHIDHVGGQLTGALVTVDTEGP